MASDPVRNIVASDSCAALPSTAYHLPFPALISAVSGGFHNLCLNCRQRIESPFREASVFKKKRRFTSRDGVYKQNLYRLFTNTAPPNPAVSQLCKTWFFTQTNKFLFAFIIPQICLSAQYLKRNFFQDFYQNKVQKKRYDARYARLPPAPFPFMGIHYIKAKKIR